MKILGLILEANPFHNGHKYFIEQAIATDQYDLVIAITSTSFNMRGEISVIDKFTKTKLYLENNIDLVLELPNYLSINSSDKFCLFNINILSSFHITDLCFGSEIGDINKLMEYSSLKDNPSFNMYLKNHLDNGLSYSTSINKALLDLGVCKDDVNEYTKPNNTLAIGYINAIKELNLNINLHTIKRTQNNYYDTKITNDIDIASASQIRALLNNKNDINKYIPSAQYEKIGSNLFINENIAKERMLEILKYNFLIHPIEYFNSIHLINEGIENRIQSFINKATNYDELTKLVQTKRYNLNRINRIFVNILLENKKQKEQKEQDREIFTYLRILGMNEKGKKYLSKLDKDTKKMLISSISKLDNYPNILEYELKSSRLFDILTDKSTYELEFKTPIKY